ncbi:MAG TPA: hypothetical protein VM889_04435 [Candidatus Thermoplasmatota archaeon]|nr:hypothetical protein [Candidatus Thermoplasmatota archaeon]
MVEAFAVGACADLGLFDPGAKDHGVGRFAKTSARVVDWLVLMEDRQPDFFHGWRGYDPAAEVPLNRHGPRSDRWTERDLKGLVASLKAEGIRPYLGYWIHECRWVDEEEPGLLMRDARGETWQNLALRNADFNPLKRLKDGRPYAAFAADRWRGLAAAFGFDGLFLGDGAMGFRQHGHDLRGLTTFDYSDAWLAEFAASANAVPHEGCLLGDERASVPDRARDVQTRHWREWIAFNVRRWTDFYGEMAAAVHATGGRLAAYNVMNYDPAMALVHGIDYRALAGAGLDHLVFQSYDYAWGPNGPFGFLNMTRKDLATNARAFLATRAALGHQTKTRLSYTTETSDSVEHWAAPIAHTIGEVHAMGGARSFDGTRWRPAADETFVVWANDVPEAHWRALARAWRESVRGAEPEGPVLVWRERDHEALVDEAPILADVEALYAPLDRLPTLEGEDAAAVPGGIVLERDVAKLAPRLRAGARRG